MNNVTRPPEDWVAFERQCCSRTFDLFEPAQEGAPARPVGGGGVVKETGRVVATVYGEEVVGEQQDVLKLFKREGLCLRWTWFDVQGPRCPSCRHPEHRGRCTERMGSSVWQCRCERSAQPCE